MEDKNKHTAYTMPYNEVSNSTSEDILNMIVNGKFNLISKLLSYAKRPKPPYPQK